MGFQPHLKQFSVKIRLKFYKFIMSLNQFLTIISSPTNEILSIFSTIISFGLMVLMFYKIKFFRH